jgi:hypothetical protein
MVGGKVCTRMPKLDVAEPALAGTPPLPLVDPNTVAALDIAGGFFEMVAAWQGVLQRRLFDEVDLSTDRKAELKLRKRLLSQQGYSVLMAIWKESDHVSDAGRTAAGVARVGTDSAPINCHNLAKAMEASSQGFDSQEKRVQGVAEAAEAYGLVERKTCESGRQRPLCGTACLHALMLEFTEEVRSICADIAASSPGGQ